MKLSKYLRIALSLLALGLSACGSNNRGTALSKLSSNAPAGSEAPASVPGQVPGGTVQDFKLICEEARFIHLINIYRQSKNLSPLNVSKNATLAARWHGQDMISKNYFSHTEPSGRTFDQRAASFGYYANGENIAAGTSTANQVFCQWQTSAGHNANMLGAYQSTGIGLSSGGGTYGVYWSSNFGPSANDEIAAPLTTDSDCAMPIIIPNCY